MNYVLGVAVRNAANTRLRTGTETDRATFLATVAEQWARPNPSQYPFVHEAATRLHEHDDRDQFLAGVDIFLVGMATLR